MIDYSVSSRPNPMDREANPKYYATAQLKGVIDINRFAKHIASHGSVYKRADISAVLTMAVDCLKEMLLEGYKVQLGDLGNFYVSLSSEGANLPQEFNPNIHVKEVKVNWERGTDFYNLKNETEFNLVAIRAIQKKVLAALKNGEEGVEFYEDPLAPFEDPNDAGA